MIAMIIKYLIRCFLLLAGLSTFLACDKDQTDPKNLPQVKTFPVTITQATRVIANGEVSDEGRSTVTSRGFCWAMNINPSIQDNISQVEMGLGVFSKEIVVIPDTNYYIRTYATNKTGTTYGNEYRFSTTGSFTGEFTDSRDGVKYRCVKIGDQIWMAENLAYLPTVNPSRNLDYNQVEVYYFVYGYEGTNIIAAKQSDNYKTYGVLYNRPAVMSGDSAGNTVPSGVKGVCPDGWHLPSDAEWTILTDYLGENTGLSLKSNGGWANSGNGNNYSGFTALPGGFRDPYTHFTDNTFNAYFCSASTEESTVWIIARGLYYDYQGTNRIRYEPMWNYGFSVRCLKD
jgi:uncharacterized protein (TIGR02145 family)